MCILSLDATIQPHHDDDDDDDDDDDVDNICGDDADDEDAFDKDAR